VEVALGLQRDVFRIGAGGLQVVRDHHVGIAGVAAGVPDGRHREVRQRRTLRLVPAVTLLLLGLGRGTFGVG
jgi:hypothetical protein